MAKVHVNTRPVADQYSGPGEKIIEYSAPGGHGIGGLIAFRWDADSATMRVDLYRHDPAVTINVGPAGS